MLFLPFKKKADATAGSIVHFADSCFYLSKRRQMQPTIHPTPHLLVVFTFQKEGRCNGYLVNDSFPICFLCFLGYTSSLFIY